MKPVGAEVVVVQASRRVLLVPRRPLSGAAQKRKLCALCVSVVHFNERL